MLKTLSITATAGRHTLLERSVGMFIAQDYKGPHTQLIFNNSDVPQVLHLPELPSNKRIILINSCNKKYKNLGEIYTDAASYISDDIDIINFHDDDDIFLPNHISEGVKGYQKAKEGFFLAYKPERSWYRSHKGVNSAINTLEPSMFVSSHIIKTVGFHFTTSDQHLKWVEYLRKNNLLLIDPTGVPTLVYNWGDNIPTWKTSGDPDNPNNFNNYRNFSKDHGDGIIVPWKPDKIKEFYDTLFS